jgi:hypothetical protein
MTGDHATSQLSAVIAERLAHPRDVPRLLSSRPWWRLSLAHGALGIALLHIERAAAGLASWQPAHDWLTYVASGPVTTGADSHLCYGAPALGHVLACATAARPGSYARALNALDQAIATDTLARVNRVQAHIDAGRLPALAEFDLIRGLTGSGTYLLRRDPGRHGGPGSAGVPGPVDRTRDSWQTDTARLVDPDRPDGPRERTLPRRPRQPRGGRTGSAARSPCSARPSGRGSRWLASRRRSAGSAPGSTCGARAPAGRTGSTAHSSAPSTATPRAPNGWGGATAQPAWPAPRVIAERICR